MEPAGPLHVTDDNCGPFQKAVENLVIFNSLIWTTEDD